MLDSGTTGIQHKKAFKPEGPSNQSPHALQPLLRIRSENSEPGQGSLGQMAACPGAHRRQARRGGRHQAGVHAVQGRGQIKAFLLQDRGRSVEAPEPVLPGFPRGQQSQAGIPSRFSGRIVSLSAATRVAMTAEAPIMGSVSRKSGGASGAGQGRQGQGCYCVLACRCRRQAPAEGKAARRAG